MSWIISILGYGYFLQRYLNIYSVPFYYVIIPYPYDNKHVPRGLTVLNFQLLPFSILLAIKMKLTSFLEEAIGSFCKKF